MMDAIDWWRSAACRLEDPELFFPMSGVGRAQQTARAKAVCARCPVRVRCLDLALRSGRLDHGIFGGMTGRERRELLRRSPATCGDGQTADPRCTEEHRGR